MAIDGKMSRFDFWENTIEMLSMAQPWKSPEFHIYTKYFVCWFQLICDLDTKFQSFISNRVWDIVITLKTDEQTHSSPPNLLKDHFSIHTVHVIYIPNFKFLRFEAIAITKIWFGMDAQANKQTNLMRWLPDEWTFKRNSTKSFVC